MTPRESWNGQICDLKKRAIENWVCLCFLTRLYSQFIFLALFRWTPQCHRCRGWRFRLQRRCQGTARSPSDLRWHPEEWVGLWRRLRWRRWESRLSSPAVNTPKQKHVLVSKMIVVFFPLFFAFSPQDNHKNYLKQSRLHLKGKDGSSDALPPL